MTKSVLVGIPCFNEEETVGAIVKEILSLESPDLEFKVVVIDDGSSDDTSIESMEAGAEVLRHEANRGLGGAFESFREFALKRSEHYFVLIDGDGQFSPSQIPSLVLPLINHECDVVIGSRFVYGKPSTQPWRNYYGNRLANRLVSSATKSHFTDVSSGFRAFSRKSLSLLRNLGSFNFSQHTVLQARNLGLIIVEVPVFVEYFDYRKSRMAPSFSSQSLRISRSVLHSIQELYPFYFYSRLSLLLFVPCLFFGIVFILHFLRTGQFTGYLFAGFTSAFFFAISLIFISVGLISQSLIEIKKDQSRIIGRLDRSAKEVA